MKDDKKIASKTDDSESGEANSGSMQILRLTYAAAAAKPKEAESESKIIYLGLMFLIQMMKNDYFINFFI